MNYNPIENPLTLEEQFDDLYTSIDIMNLMSSDAFLESGDGKGFLNNFAEKINEVIRSLKRSITKTKLEESKTELENSPNVDLDKQVQITDYDKLQELNQDMLKAISTNQFEIEKKMEKYRKQRNAIIKGGALITLSLGALLRISTVRSKKQIDECERIADEAKRNCERYQRKLNEAKTDISKRKEKINELQSENEKMKNKIERMSTKNPVKKAKIVARQSSDVVSSKISDTQANIKGNQIAMHAQLEVLKNASDDALNSTRELANIMHSEASNVKKGIALVSAKSKIKSDIQNAKNNIKNGEYSDKQAGDIARQLKEIKIKRNKAKKVISDNRDSENVQKAKNYLKNSEKEYSSLIIAYNKLTGK